MSEIANFSDSNRDDDFFKYTRERFVLDEANNTSTRSIRFDMNELARLAASSVGARACVNVEKCADGMYNKAFVLTMDDGQRVIGKVPNPNAGIPHLTTASEVATIDFVGLPAWISLLQLILSRFEPFCRFQRLVYTPGVPGRMVVLFALSISSWRRSKECNFKKYGIP